MEETKERIEYKIYQIVCNETGEVYFGKTTKTLEERLYYHVKALSCTSKQIILRGDYKIEQIDSTFDEEESIILERYHIETYECVNKQIPGRTRKEYNKKYKEEHKEEISEYHKNWREEHKEEKSEYNKKYREEHKEEISKNMKEWRELNPEYNKEYREAHKEEISEKKKENYEAHRDEILEKKKIKYTCECGSTLTIQNKARHEKTQRHINYMNSKK